MPLFIGIDPGSTGAAVALGPDGLTVLGLQTWSKTGDNPPAITLASAGDIVSLEAQHVGKGNRSSLKLAERAGHLLASLPPGVTILRPLATTWRARVLGSGRLQREPAKRLAIAAARQWLAAVDYQDKAGDASEAWCMARYSWGWDLAGRPAVSA